MLFFLHGLNSLFLLTRIFPVIIIGLAQLINRDDLLVKFIKQQLLRLGEQDLRRKAEVTNLRTKARTLARLLALVCEEYQQELPMSDILLPSFFDSCVRAAKCHFKAKQSVRTHHRQLSKETHFPKDIRCYKRKLSLQKGRVRVI